MRAWKDFIFWKRRTEIFLQFSFNNKNTVYENRFKAFNVKINRDSVQCSHDAFYQGGTSVFKFIVHVLTT